MSDPRSSFESLLLDSGDFDIARCSGFFDAPFSRFAANPPATPARAAPPASSGVFAFEAAVAMPSPAVFAFETTDSRAEASPLFDCEPELVVVRDFV